MSAICDAQLQDRFGSGNHRGGSEKEDESVHIQSNSKCWEQG